MFRSLEQTGLRTVGTKGTFESQGHMGVSIYGIV